MKQWFSSLANGVEHADGCWEDKEHVLLDNDVALCWQLGGDLRSEAGTQTFPAAAAGAAEAAGNAKPEAIPRGFHPGADACASSSSFSLQRGTEARMASPHLA